MTSEIRDKSERHLNRLYAFLSEESLSASGEEVKDYGGPEGAARSEALRGLLLDTVKVYRQSALRRALAVYEEEVRRYRDRQSSLPQDASGRRELLGNVLQRFGDGERTFLTLQHREFKKLSDSDVESLLQQLDALGVLNG